MKTIDLSKGKHSVAELLALAKSDTVLIHSPSGDDFLLEQADEFDREVAALGRNEKFLPEATVRGNRGASCRKGAAKASVKVS